MTIVSDLKPSYRKMVLFPAALAMLALAGCETPMNGNTNHTSASQSNAVTDDAMIPADDTAQPLAQRAIPASMSPAASPANTSQLAARVPTSDSIFAQQATSASATEIALAQIAIERAQSEDVRSFARQMLADHQQLASKLDGFAKQRGYVINPRVPALGQSAITRLRAIGAGSFDSAYISEMVSAHEAAVDMLQAQAASGSETAAMASEILPVVQHHLKMARELQRQI